MKKSKDITKYEIEWQLLRVKVKGSQVDVLSKINITKEYFLQTKTYDRWERVYNWLEGLYKGYLSSKDVSVLKIIEEEMIYYKDINILLKKEYFINKDLQEDILKNAPITDIKLLWIDLFKTNKKWLQRGYFHKECNAFIDWLLLIRPEIESDKTYTKEYLGELRKFSEKKQNTHKFFF